MAFIRNYSEQGDPRGHGIARRVLRSGRLLSIDNIARAEQRVVRPTAHFRFRGHARPRARFLDAAGDPFSFRMPKFVRKLSLKKVASAVGRVAKAALPIAAPFIPGIGPFIEPLLGGSFAGGGGPDSPAPELVQDPGYQGPVGEMARTFEAPMYRSSRRDDGTYPGDYDEDDYGGGPDDEDDDDEDDYDDGGY